MQTVSKTYGAADTEAQVPEQEPLRLGRAKVALICVAAALSGAAVASVARVRTRAYVADLYGGVSYDMGLPGTMKTLNAEPLQKGEICDPDRPTCAPGLECFERTNGKAKCFASCPTNGKFLCTTSKKKKKPSTDPLSGDIGTCSAESKRMAKEPGAMCYTIYAPVCGEDGQEYSNDCNACMAGNDKYTKGGC